MHLDLLGTHPAPLAHPPHPLRPVETHHLGCNAWRGGRSGEASHRITSEAGLFLEFATRCVFGALVSIDQSGRQIDDAILNWLAKLFCENDLTVIGDREDRDRLFRVLALDEFPSVAFENDDVFSLEDFHRGDANTAIAAASGGGLVRASDRTSAR